MRRSQPSAAGPVLGPCHDWSRSPTGCMEPCPKGRPHLCEFCKGAHRGVDCPTKGKGKGKGKNKVDMNDSSKRRKKSKA